MRLMINDLAIWSTFFDLLTINGAKIRTSMNFMAELIPSPFKTNQLLFNRKSINFNF
jgi:hypothetical protein